MLKDKQRRHPETLVGWMEALADRTRLRLMRILERNELGVVELCEILQLPQSTVSRHLKILSDQGWVQPRREGTTRLYRASLEQLEPAARKLWMLAKEQTDDWPAVQQDQIRLARRLRNREIDSQTFFAGAAGKWDQLRKDLYGESFTIAAMLALLPENYVVADLGCGTGQVTQQLAEHVQRVIGVDNSPAMLKAARKRIGQRQNVELLRADLSDLPLQDSTCDAAMLLLVLTYAPDPQIVIHQAARILKPGGKLVIVDLLEHDRVDFVHQMGQQHMGFSSARTVQLLQNAPLTNPSIRSLPPEPQAKGPALFLATAVHI